MRIKQRPVGASLGNGPILQNQDFIGVLDRGQAVGDHQHRLSPDQRFKRPLDQQFVFWVCKGRSFIQHDDGCVF